MRVRSLPPSLPRRVAVKQKGAERRGDLGGWLAMALLYGKTEKQVMGVSEQKSAK